MVYALWQEIPKLVYAFLTLQPVVVIPQNLLISGSISCCQIWGSFEESGLNLPHPHQITYSIARDFPIIHLAQASEIYKFWSLILLFFQSWLHECVSCYVIHFKY